MVGSNTCSRRFKMTQKRAKSDCSIIQGLEKQLAPARRGHDLGRSSQHLCGHTVNQYHHVVNVQTEIIKSETILDGTLSAVRQPDNARL